MDLAVWFKPRCLSQLTFRLKPLPLMAQQPKKPAGGAFGQFLAEKRQELQKELEGQPITAITKLASSRFKELSEEEQKSYEEKYVAAKAKYDEDMKAFLDAGGEKKVVKRKGKDGKAKKVKDPQAPKRPAGGAFGCYLAKNRAAFQKECSGQPVTAITKLAAAKWKELSEEDKKIFEDEYQTKKDAYQEAMKSYVPLPPAEDDEPPAKKVRISKEEKEAAKQEKAKAKEVEKAKKLEKKAEKATKKSQPKAKAKAKGKAKAKDAPAAVELQATVATKAEKLGWTEQLKKLAARDDIKASGKSQTAMLKALEESGGLIHPAKRALLGA